MKAVEELKDAEIRVEMSKSRLLKVREGSLKASWEEKRLTEKGLDSYNEVENILRVVGLEVSRHKGMMRHASELSEEIKNSEDEREGARSPSITCLDLDLDLNLDLDLEHVFEPQNPKFWDALVLGLISVL